MIEVLMQNLKSMCKHEKCFENTNQAKRLVGEVVDDIVVGARDLGFDFQSSQTPCCHSGRIFRNGCTENFRFVFQRCDWLDQLREYAASNEIFCLFCYTTTLPRFELHG